MQRLCLSLLLIVVTSPLFSQHIYKIKTDSLLVTNDSCTAELNLENSTKFVNGFLYNKGKGRTEFRRAMIKLTDSTYLFGNDTLNFRSLLNTIGFSGTNIYNSNGSLTANRTLILGGYSLSYQSGSNIVEHMFANGNKWLGNGTPVDNGYKLDITGNVIFRATSGMSIATINSAIPGIRYHRSTFSLNDYGDGFTLDSGSVFTFKSYDPYRYIYQMEHNAVRFSSGYSFFGNYGAPMEFRFTDMNTFQMNPLLPNGYAQGLTVSLNGGTGGNWANVDNRGVPGKLILNGGSAQSNENTLNANASNVEINGGKGTGTGTGGDLVISTSTTQSYGTTLQTLVERMRVKYNSGNVLIGTATDAGYKLDVNGTGRFVGNLVISNSGYLNITSNNKIYIGGTSYGFNTFMSNTMPQSANEGYGNTYLGVVDNHNTPTGTMYNTIIGAINNRSGVNGSSNVIVGSGNRNYLTPGNDTQNQTIIIGSGVYTASAYNFNKVFYLGFDSPLSGNLNSVMSFAGSATSLDNNSLTFGNSGPNKFQLDNVYFNSKQSDIGYAGRPITLNGAGGTGNNIAGGNLILAGGKGTGTGTPGDFIISTSTTLTSGSTLQTLSNRWWVKGGTGYLGNSSTPTSALDITGTTGYSQFRLRTSYTPTSTSDANGSVGDFSWDDNYFYIKTSTGWKRSALTTF